MTLSELKKIVTDAGIVGAGGAGFPTSVKFSDQADTLIINAVECEPLLYTDFYILKEELAKVISAAELVIDACGMREGFLSIKEHTAARLSLQDGDLIGNRIRVKVLPNVYPMGDEIVLIYETIGRVIEPGALPITAGVIVNNAETLYNIYNAVYGGTPVTEKWLTVGGDIETSVVIKAYVGTPVIELLNSLNIEIPEGYVVLDGGPAMGNVINPSVAVVTKRTKALILLPETTPAVISKLQSDNISLKRAASACCSCSRCTDLCPRHLLGYSLEPHKIIRAANSGVIDPQLYTNAQLCCSCGVCEMIACCNNLSPKRIYRHIKTLMAQNKIRYKHDGSEVKVSDVREYRMLPSSRFMRMLGIEKYDKLPKLIRNFELMPSRITLSLNWHVGAPATANVKVGDFVCTGDIVGTAHDGISANIHSPIDGMVIDVKKDKVIIGD